MKDRQRTLHEFMEKILLIERELDKLENISYELFELYDGTAFAEQTKLAANMENFVIAMTHETASQLSFYRNDVENLAKFIEFRKQYCEFADNELAEILDGTFTLEQKRNLSSRFDTAEKMFARLNELKQNWNEIFKSCDYVKLKKQLRI
ncbi:MAG: hypothetical protein LBV07_01175 [Syntrophobacterales bacterium]|jgi:hypothetical protein|nr:hypothetical protein [Syntrophobacterales bacterium]